ncbi:MAG: hypothetical protein SPD11_01340, partial [Sphaerochaetaceae bacterium]|nr:hypothetical protein [Sphaerochaetaceae bacterium]
ITLFIIPVLYFITEKRKITKFYRKAGKRGDDGISGNVSATTAEATEMTDRGQGYGAAAMPSLAAESEKAPDGERSDSTAIITAPTTATTETGDAPDTAVSVGQVGMAGGASGTQQTYAAPKTGPQKVPADSAVETGKVASDKTTAGSCGSAVNSKGPLVVRIGVADISKTSSTDRSADKKKEE